MNDSKGKIVFQEETIREAVDRLAKAIAREVKDRTDEVVLIGIARGGIPLAQRLQKAFPKAKRGVLDITFYRDDIALRETHPVIKHTEIPFSLDHQTVVLVDDVLFSGRTIRAALDALVDFGRPACVRLAALVDRGHRELPIHGDFVGFEMKTKLRDRVEVIWREYGQGPDMVRLIDGK